LAQTALACLLALVALVASVFHLGRPWLAWRVFLGLRTSWLSREAIAFGVFAQLGILYGILAGARLLPDFPAKAFAMSLTSTVQASAAGVGVLGVLFSVMVYAATRRAHWSGVQTGLKFFGTTLLLGAAAVLVVYVMTGGSLDAMGRQLLALVMTTTLLKLAVEASVLTQVRNRRHTTLKRVAILLTHELGKFTRARFGLAVLGGILLPLLLRAGLWPQSLAIVCSLSLVCLTAGELLERYLFFRAAPASRMPGGLR